MRQKFAVIGFSYLAGLIFASLFSAFSVVFALILIALGVFSGIKYEFKKAAVYALLASALGIILYFGADLIGNAIQESYTKDIYQVKATVTEARPLKRDTAIYTLKVKSGENRFKCIMFADSGIAETGDEITFAAKFSKIKSNGYYDSAAYYKADGIFLSAVPMSEITLSKSGKGIFYYIEQWRNSLKTHIDVLYPDNAGGLMKAIFFSDKAGLSFTADYNLKAAGAAHFTAVSGTHLGIIITFLAVILNILFYNRLTLTKAVIIIAVTAFSAVFFGLTPSVVRCCIMLILCNIGGIFFRRSDTLNSLGLAILIIAVPYPLSGVSPAMLYTVTATVGVGVLGPAMAREIRVRVHKAGAFTDMLCCSVCAAAAVTPITVLMFGYASPYSAFATILAMPFVTIALISLLVSFLLPFTSGLFLPVAHFCCGILNAVFGVTAALPFAAINAEYTLTGYFIVISVAVFAAFALLLNIRKSAKLVTAIAICASYIAVILCCGITSLFYGNNYAVPFTDGVNSSVLINSGGVNIGIVDGGGRAAEFLYKTAKLRNAEIDVLMLTDNSRISVSEIGEYFSDAKVIVSDEKIRQGLTESGYFGDNIIKSDYKAENISLDGKCAEIGIDGVRLCVYSDYATGTGDINIYFDGGNGIGVPCYTDKKIDGGINLYYQDVVFYINGGVISPRF